MAENSTPVNKRLGTYDRLNLPTALSVGIVVFCTVCTLSPYAAGQDFGIFKVPTFSAHWTNVLRIVGPIIVALSVIGFLPVWRRGPKPSKTNVYMTADDLKYRLREPYNNRMLRASVNVRTEVSSGSIVLSREAILVETKLQKKYLSETGGKIKLLSVSPSQQIVSAGQTATITIEFDVGSVIPEVHYATNCEQYIGTKFGELDVDIPYQIDNEKRDVRVNIPLKFGDG